MNNMKNFFSIIAVIFISSSLTASAQNGILGELGSDPRKAYGNDYPYGYAESTLSPVP